MKSEKGEVLMEEVMIIALTIACAMMFIGCGTTLGRLTSSHIYKDMKAHAKFIEGSIEGSRRETSKIDNILVGSN